MSTVREACDDTSVDRHSILTNSSSKGIPEKEYAFDIELFDEILPEVRYNVSILKHISEADMNSPSSKPTGDQEVGYFPSHRADPPKEGRPCRVLASTHQGEGQEPVDQDRLQQVGR